ncbi:hypothetical protein NDU88_005861 [Pleurodeles waltl]|uniref:Uncharacterized protein n=1 Tax=Pleurodeles waltl TaxID=8319 RepID=A0AAV7TWR8_PLEWA|nr:hypothetical protein NDU88_005861 [Pleurodeles waltl]
MATATAYGDGDPAAGNRGAATGATGPGELLPTDDPSEGGLPSRPSQERTGEWRGRLSGRSRGPASVRRWGSGPLTASSQAARAAGEPLTSGGWRGNAEPPALPT